MNNLKKSLSKPNRRPNSVAIIGALFGDEGKGRITDELANYFLNDLKFKEIVLYRDNGGANAGHTISYNGKTISLHQIGSGILHKGCYVVLGKGMVLHPNDLLDEIDEIKRVFNFKQLPSNLIIDENAVLSLDTHRALEAVIGLSSKQSLGSMASTGRGISPAYADVIYRFPLTMKDLMIDNWKEKFSEHYERYNRLITGFGVDMKDITINRFDGKVQKVGSKDEFLTDLEQTRELLRPYVSDIHDFIKYHWSNTTPFIFEKAQAVGLDSRWGVYPDVTASNCCLDGITYSTEGIIDYNDISARLGVIKSTYMSSVGKRILPSKMDEKLAERIRTDGNEYGATTKRPREIYNMDLVMLKYFCNVCNIEEIVFTHMDIIYEEPVKLCVNYKIDNNDADYRPNQEYLNTVVPEYKEFKPWKADNFQSINDYNQIEDNAKEYMQYICTQTNTQPAMLTYGPQRNQTIIF